MRNPTRMEIERMLAARDAEFRMKIERWLAARDAELARLGCRVTTDAELPAGANASLTGDYVITPYRLHGERAKVVYILGTPYQLQDGQANEVCILDGHEDGEWWYGLNDAGLVDVGRFASREAAIEWATKSIEDYRRVMGGKVRSVSVRVSMTANRQAGD